MASSGQRWGRRVSRLVLALASGNAGKLRELRDLLSDLPIEVDAAGALGSVVYPEEGAEYVPNSIAKAQAAAAQLGCSAVADDSGLEVDGLDGGPGPLSARYGGPGLDDQGRVDHLLSELARRPSASRQARFVCVASFVSLDGQVYTERGECPGRILLEPKGEGGFGYDPVFEPEGYSRSMAQLQPDEKQAISHRGRALALLRSAIEAGLGLGG